MTAAWVVHPPLPGCAPARQWRPRAAQLRLRRASRRTQHTAGVFARGSGRWQDRPAPAAAPLAAPKPTVGAEQGRGWRTFWTAVDTSAWLGTVGTAVAFILTQEAMLAAAPVVLPLLALYASRQRERLAAAAERAAQLARLEELLLELQAEAADEVAAEVGAEVQGLLAALQQQQRSGLPSPEVTKLLRGLDGKLSAVEGSVVSTGAATREALQRSAEAQGQLASSVMGRLQDLGTALRRDVNGALAAAGEADAAALSRLDARLASLEGAIAGLQAVQSDSLARLDAGLQQAAADASGAVQAAVREEAYRSLEPLRRLPELLAAAMPVTPEVLGPLDRALPALSEESLRAAVGDALGGAVREILEQQAALLEELAGQPQAIVPQQWNQLGARLGYLQEQLADLAALQQAAAASTRGGDDGGDGVATAAAEVAAVAADLAGLRSDLASLTTAVQQLLDEQRQGGGGAAGSGSGAAAGGVPQGSLAAAAAAVQAVQDQVVLLRQDLEEGDARQAAVAALEEQLEAALVPLFEALGGEGGAAGNAAAGNGAARAEPIGPSAEALQQQQAALATALQSLSGLGERLDGMAAQLAALQAGVAAVAAAPAPAAAPAAGPGAEVQDKLEEQQQQDTEVADAAANGSAADVPQGEADGRDAAYRRMQQMLQQRPPGAAADLRGQSFAEWLSGHRENAVPASTASAVAPPTRSAASAAAAQADSNGSGASGGVRGQIEFAAAMGLVEGDEEKLSAADAAADNGAALWEEAAAAQASLPAEGAAGSSSLEPAEWQGDAMRAAPAEVQELWEEQQQEQQQGPAGWQQQGPDGLAQQQAAAQDVDAAGQLAGGQMGGVALAAAEAQLSAEQLYERGVQRLREGRALAATPGADLGLADAALWEAADCFEQLLARHDPGSIRARGNYGNALLSQGRLKKQMLDALSSSAAPLDQAQAAAVAAAAQRLAGEAEELLLLAGRQYKAVLEADPAQAKAFINWGRVIGLRADMARAAGKEGEAGRLFSLAADKFDAALDLEPQSVAALRMGGQAVLDAALCTLGGDPREARSLLKDAAAYLEAALGLDPQDTEAAAALERCRAQLAEMREQRQRA